MNTLKKISLSLSCLALLIVSCRKKDALIPEATPLISGIESNYYVLIKETILLQPVIENRVDSIVWLVNGVRVANDLQYLFQAPVEPNTYNLLIRAYNRGNIVEKLVRITTGRYHHWKTTVNTILQIDPSRKFEGRDDIKWEMFETSSERYRLNSNTDQTAMFAAVDTGIYKIVVSSGNLSDTLILTVQETDHEQSPYFTKVFDYLPAPGQFVNEMPKYNEGDTYEMMVDKVSKVLVGEDAGTITLGGWGGFVVLGFDHTIVNVAGKRDFRINGNAFGAAANPRPSAPFGGSCEPGIIMVAYDKNKNGKPDDDEWYEIKGSGNFSAENERWYSIAVNNSSDTRTFRNYEMTYMRPTSETPAADPEGYISIANYIAWSDNQGQHGFKVKNTFHRQSYYPAWVQEDKITYKGIRLAHNAIDESKQGNYFVLYAYDFGYVDNYPNSHDNSAIDIDWAIDKNGDKANLPGIDFVKVYNGVNQENGWLGEASTEVSRGEDLHLLEAKKTTIK